MAMLTAERLIIAFKKLGDFLGNPDEDFKSLMAAAQGRNAWFTAEELQKAVHSLHSMLNEADLQHWFSEIRVTEQPKKVGLILAGNIPMVGFHDVLCVLATGNIALIKLSSSDDRLLPVLLSRLTELEPLLKSHVEYVERLKDFDAVIATGSNNTSRYFDYYFGKVPNIIRKNRNSLAVLSGAESMEDISALGHDIFDYFGLGCRNVSKIFIPEDYDIRNFFEPLEGYKDIINHFKYNNNYDYNKSIYLVNSAAHYDNGFLLLKEDEGMSSPLAVLYYERYTDLAGLGAKLSGLADQIQCVVSNTDLGLEQGIVGFGTSQQPKLWDYADNVNTIEFLNGL